MSIARSEVNMASCVSLDGPRPTARIAKRTAPRISKKTPRSSRPLLRWRCCEPVSIIITGQRPEEGDDGGNLGGGKLSSELAARHDDDRLGQGIGLPIVKIRRGHCD